MYLSLSLLVGTGGVGHGMFSNLQSNASLYNLNGQYTSAVYDAGQSVTWDTITWDATLPATTDLVFQIAVSNSPTGPFTFVGPDGTSATNFSVSGTSIYSGTTGRYACYQANLSGDYSTTPTLNRVDLIYTGTNTSTHIEYDYDAVGNMVGKVTEAVGSTTVTETRTVNNLNQITANSVVGATTTNWTYDYDPDGNMTSRSDGTNTTSYTFDEDNRFTLVTLPDTSTVAYTYDVQGRMLTRTDPSGTTTFVWDGWNCIQETDPSGNVTRYYVLGGRLWSFDRTVSAVTSVYQVHADALGSVRKVTDSSGSVVATYDYDAWGNQLASTSDPLAFPYRYVGALGVRWDSVTGLYYMRNRWYDPTLQRFLSRDPKRNRQLYAYAANDPSTYNDPTGLQYGGTEGYPTPTPPPTSTLSGEDLILRTYSDIVNRVYAKGQQYHTDCTNISLQILCALRELQKKGKLADYNLQQFGWNVGVETQMGGHGGVAIPSYTHEVAVVANPQGELLVLDPISFLPMMAASYSGTGGVAIYHALYAGLSLRATFEPININLDAECAKLSVRYY